jgi:hypothetical protein
MMFSRFLARYDFSFFCGTADVAMFWWQQE